MTYCLVCAQEEAQRRYPGKQIVLVSPQHRHRPDYLQQLLRKFEDVKVLNVAFRWDTKDEVSQQ